MLLERKMKVQKQTSSFTVENFWSINNFSNMVFFLVIIQNLWVCLFRHVGFVHEILDWNVQLHTNRAPHHSALVFCWTKYLQSYPERFYVLHCNNFSLVLSQAESVWHLIHIRTIVHAKWGPRGIRQRPSDRRYNKSDKVILYYHISYRLLRRRLGEMKLKNGMNLEPEVLLNPAPT